MMSRVAVKLSLMVCTVVLAGCDGGSTGLEPSGPWARVAAGDQFTCALTTVGKAYCWGAGIFGQLGNNGTQPVAVPAEVVGGHVFRALAVGSDHVCAISEFGNTWCWGLNDFSELGVGTGACNATFPFASCARVPLHVKNAPEFDSIAVAGYSSCGITAAGAAHCWGWSDHGQAGGTVGEVIDTPTPIAAPAPFASLSLDIYHICAVTTAQSLFCWGSNQHGQLAADSVATPKCGTGAGFRCSPSPVAAAAGLAVRSVTTGSTHTCGVTVGQGVFCWGSNQYGTLGNPNALGGATPVPVAGNLGFTRADAGLDHTCALDAGGAAWCWGLNTFGQLGVATVSEACPSFGSAAPCSNSPAAVETPVRFAAISAGTSHSCGLSDDGDIWCWGRGGAGQLGDGRSVSSNAPVRVGRP